MSVTDTLRRRTVPSLVIRLSTVRAPARAAAALRRALGRRGRVELFVAFDDPLSAVALLGLEERLRGRAVDLIVRPVVERGIPGDPAVEAKRAYAVLDAARLARRDGRTLARTTPVPPDHTAPLAHQAAALAPAERLAFSLDAMRSLWFGVAPADAGGAGAWPCLTGTLGDEGPEAPSRPGAGTARPPRPPEHPRKSSKTADRRFRRKRLYDTPVAIVHGQWFFAHERLAAVEHRLDELGWTA